MILSTILGLFTAAVLLLAGYIFGAIKGRHIRMKLLNLLEIQQKKTEMFKDSTGKKIDLLVSQGDQIQQAVQHDRVALELTNMQSNSKNRGDLTRFMDEMADKAQFESILLSDENGLPIAASSNAKHLEKLAAISSFVVIFGDRISRVDAANHLSHMLHDSENKETLCRIFHVGNQRLVLTAVSFGMPLTCTALDPALSKLSTILSTEVR